MNLSNYILICDAIVRLIDPLVEIVIHDIVDDRVIYVNGKLSNRKIGDASLFDPEELGSIFLMPYPITYEEIRFGILYAFKLLWPRSKTSN